MKRQAALEQTLRLKGKNELLERLETAQVPEDVEIVTIYQDEPLGLGHAVLCARDACLGGPVGVILPDDLIMGGRTLSLMADAYDASRVKSLIASLEVSRTDISSSGVFDFAEDVSDRFPRPANGLVEKPDADDAPSLHAAIGRYILDDCIFEFLARTDEGAGGEVQLTDAIASCGDIFAFPVHAPRFDCGSHDGLFEASEWRRDKCRTQTLVAIAAE